MMPKEKMIGQAGEHLVCSELSANQMNCSRADESCPYDIILDYGQLAKIQVKTSNYSVSPISIKFTVSQRNSKNRCYKPGDIDLFALVWLDGKEIAWLPYAECSGWKKSIKKAEFGKYTLQRALSILKSND